MKRYIALILALMMSLSLCACGGADETPESAAPETEVATDTTKNSYEDVREALIGDWGWIIVEAEREFAKYAHVDEFRADGHGTKIWYNLDPSGEIESATSWPFTYEITDSQIICAYESSFGDIRYDYYSYTFEDGVLRIGVNNFYRESHKDNWLDGIIEILRKDGIDGLEEKHKAYIDYDE